MKIVEPSKKAINWVWQKSAIQLIAGVVGFYAGVHTVYNAVDKLLDQKFIGIEVGIGVALVGSLSFIKGYFEMKDLKEQANYRFNFDEKNKQIEYIKKLEMHSTDYTKIANVEVQKQGPIEKRKDIGTLVVTAEVYTKNDKEDPVKGTYNYKEFDLHLVENPHTLRQYIGSLIPEPNKKVA